MGKLSKYPSVYSPTPNPLSQFHFNHFYLFPSDSLFLNGTLSGNMGIEEMEYTHFSK